MSWLEMQPDAPRWHYRRRSGMRRFRSPSETTFRQPHNLPVDTTIPVRTRHKTARPFISTEVLCHGSATADPSTGGHQMEPMVLSFLNNEVLRPNSWPERSLQMRRNITIQTTRVRRLVWYHDHAWGITRLNAYAGIATGYVINDTAAEAAFVLRRVFPGPRSRGPST